MKTIYLVMVEQTYGYDCPVTAFVTQMAAQQYVEKHNKTQRFYKAYWVEVFLEDK